MTCKDCTSFAECLEYESTPYYGLDAACNNVEQLCENFKNKADFVEAVRCGQCKDFEPHGNGKGGICRNRKCKGLRYATDFCSYGKRKDA